MTDPVVLVISNEQDVSVDWVVRALREHGVGLLRLNTERSTAWEIELCQSGRFIRLGGERTEPISLNGLRSVWYRRPEPPPLLNGLTRAEHRVVGAQWRAALDSIALDPGLFVMNRPDAASRAESKLLQLKIAREVGLSTPETLVTNSKRAALAFAARHESVIMKGLDAPFIDHSATPRFMFTERATDELLESMEDTEAAPLIFQEEVVNKLDIRVSVVGEVAMSAATQVPLSVVDWRLLGTAAAFGVHALEDSLAERCIALTRAMGLSFAGIDLVMRSDGSYEFLELNPNGEWGWLQKTTTLPIAETIAALLSHPPSQERPLGLDGLRLSTTS